MTTSATRENEDGPTNTWVEFTKGMCETLNEQRCLLLVALPDAVSINITRHVDNLTTRISSVREKEVDLFAILSAPRVLFSSEENIAKVQRCTAVHGRVPMLVVLEMGEDRSFVLDLTDKTTEEELERFLRCVQSGAAVPALQGAPPPPADIFEPTHGVVLNHAVAAVTCSIERLKRARAGGAACVYWSDRCKACPAMMILIDKITGFVWEAAKHKGLEQPFTYMTCNIDQNELPPEDWPTDSSRQVVPTIVVYTPEGQRVVYEEKRTPTSLTAFVCAHCLPKKANGIADITAEAVANATNLCDYDLPMPESAAESPVDTSLLQEGATEPGPIPTLSESGIKDEARKESDRKRERDVSSEQMVVQKERCA